MRTLPTYLLAAACATATHAMAGCDAPESRQFDFWLGEWTVTTPDGKTAGTNRITREYEGCVIHERYTTPRGYAGESLNAWDGERKLWHQTWVDNAGTVLLLEGRFTGGAMVLEGPGFEDGRAVKHRITWTPNADGSVRQFWQTTGPNGDWKTSFDGLYRRQ